VGEASIECPILNRETAMASIKLKIEGERGKISLHSLIIGLQCQLGILKDLDVAVSGEINGSLDWVVTDLQLSSLAVVVESQSKIENKNAGPKVVNLCVTGMKQLEEEGVTPPYFPEHSLKLSKKLVGMIGKNGATGIEISSPIIPTHIATLSPKAAVNIDELLPTKYSSLGSVEGKIETLSIHKTTKFVVYHAITQRAIACKFDQNQLEQIKNILGRRVNVYGTISYNAKGEPLRVEDIIDIRLLKEEHELPTIKDIYGIDPDFTGGLDSVEYLRRLRLG